jgi:hypothetical protein
MLGFGATGQYALGQVSHPGAVLIGVYGTGVAATLSASTGTVPSVYGTGAVGVIIPSTLQINPRRLLANVLRRLRTLGAQNPSP